MDQNIKYTSWQERYHASEIYTLRYKVLDRPGMLGKLITAIGRSGAHVGTINVVGLDSQYKLRDITVYCKDKAHLQQILEKTNGCEGIEVLEARDDILAIHKKGTIEIKSKVKITNLSDLRMLYTPGVAAVCSKIYTEHDSIWDLTGVCDRVAIVTNGTAVLGIGNVGVRSALAVMEGKAAIFAEFAGISAFPILVDSEDADTIVETVANISSGFGAIQLEDIAAPACFEIERRLKDKLDIPVMHDDQHGTATVVLAALINALKKTGKDHTKCSVIVLGAGAAGFAIVKIMRAFGAGDIIVYDSKGPIYDGRKEGMNIYKQELSKITNVNSIKGRLEEGFKGRDIFIGVARPGMVNKDMIHLMAKDPVVFPLSNPVGEISVDDAIEAGAKVVADGRVINNALAYPGLFRGALDARAKNITFQMQLAAAKKLAELAHEDLLLPDILDREVHTAIAHAVSECCSE